MTLKFKYKWAQPSLAAVWHYLHIPGYGLQLCKADHSNIASSVVIISNSLLQQEKERSKLKKEEIEKNNKTEIKEKRMTQESFQGLFISMSVSKDTSLFLLGVS